MPGTRTTLVGRDRHLRELRLLVDSMAGGRGYAVVLSGEAGAGKTRLAEEAASLAEAAGLRVAWATCWRHAAAPLSVWTDLVVTAGATPEPLLPEPPSSDVDPEGTRDRWVRSLAHAFRAAAGTTPLLVVIDDLQWCDPLSLHAVEVLVGLLRSSPIGMVCTVRDEPGPIADRVERLSRAGRHLVVPPLTQAELAELAVEVTGHTLPRATLTRLHDRTAGNVLFACELLGDVEDPAGWDDRARPPAAAGATAVFADRLATLSAPCQQALQAASVLGRRFRLDVLAEMLGVDAEAVLEVVEEAANAQLVRAAGVGECEFAHPLVAEACYAAEGLPRRIRLHRDTGEAMERLRARGLSIPAVEIAHHFANAAAAGVATKAAEYAALAGRDDMEQLAYEDAARDFALALKAGELCPADEERRAGLLLDLADAQAASGDRPAPRATYETAAGLARRHGWHGVLARAALGVGSGPGGFEVPPFDDRQIALLEEAAADAPLPLRAHVLGRLSVALALDPGMVARRTALSREAIALARDAQDLLALGYALASWCDVIPGPEAVDERLRATGEILECAAAVGDIRLELLGRRLRIVALLEAGRIDDTDSEIAAYAASAERVGQAVYTWYVPLWQGMRAVMDGRLEAAEALRLKAESIGATAHSDNARLLTTSQRMMSLCELGGAAGAVGFFRQLIEQLPGYAFMARPALAYALAASGEVDEARDLLRAINIDDLTVEAFGSELVTTVMMAAHAGWRAGWPALADALYDTLLPSRDRFGVDGIGAYFVGGIERALGVLAAQRNDPQTAEAHFAAALEQHRTVRSPVLVAATLRDAGLALGDSARLDEARRRFEAMGLTAAADTATAEGAARGGEEGGDPTALVSGNVFRRDGDVWLIGFADHTAHLRHSKGMTDLARLLAQPGNEIHSLDLVGGGQTVVSGGAGEAIDATARRQYRDRLAELEADLSEADAHGDAARSERLHLERDALVAELSRAYGLGGRARSSGSSAERARSTVTQRIRDAMTRIEDVHPELGRHLRRSVRTGTFCSYEPESPREWQL